MTQPVISVLMPVYNSERYLMPAVSSILNQSYTDFEFLITDDGSSDGSLAILQAFAKRDCRILLVSRPNTGYVVALNEMLGIARGEFIARMDADDVSMPRRFERQLTFMREHSDCVLVGSAVRYIDPEGCLLTHMHPPTSHEQIDKFHLEKWQPTIWHPSAFFRLEAVKSVGGYRLETEFAEDLDLWLRLAEIGVVANLDELLVDYRQHPESVAATRSRLCRQAGRRAIQDVYSRRNLGQVPDLSTDGATDESPSIFQRWAWWALQTGNRKLARKYAWKALRASPARESFKLLFCAWRGY
jgi:glycosyltransferase involved in cell wall biosynthesis